MKPLEEEGSEEKTDKISTIDHHKHHYAAIDDNKSTTMTPANAPIEDFLRNFVSSMGVGQSCYSDEPNRRNPVHLMS